MLAVILTLMFKSRLRFNWRWYLNQSLIFHLETTVMLQVFSYTKKKSLQSDDLCLDVSALGGPVKLYQCHGLGGNQLWDYNHLVRSQAQLHQLIFLLEMRRQALLLILVYYYYKVCVVS